MITLKEQIQKNPGIMSNGDKFIALAIIQLTATLILNQEEVRKNLVRIGNELRDIEMQLRKL